MMYTDWGKTYATHCACIAPTQKGKSFWSEDCSRGHLARGYGFAHWCADRPHYDRLKDYLTYMNPRRKVKFLNFARPEKVIPLGHLLTRDHSRMAMAIAGAFGAKNWDNLATYMNIMPTLLHWCAETRRPIQDAYRLTLRKDPAFLRDAAKAARETAEEIASWQDIAPARWDATFGSSRNRLKPFKDSPGLRRFFGVSGDLDIQKEVKDGSIFLQSFAGMGEAGKIAAGIMLSEFLISEGDTYFLYLDEAASYVPHDGATLLDQAAKNGIRATLMFHHFEQFADEHLRTSIEVNCGIKVVGGGLPFRHRAALVDDYFGPEVTERKIKELLRGIQTEYVLEDIEDTTYNESSGQGTNELGESFDERSGWTTRHGTRYAPRQNEITTGVIEYSLEEKRAMLAQRFNVGTGDFMVKFPDRVSALRVPYVKPYSPSAQGIVEFEQRHLRDYRSGSSLDNPTQGTHDTTAGTKTTRRRTLAPQE